MSNLALLDSGSGDARVRRQVTLRFDEFGWRSLESTAASEGETLEQLLGDAVNHYLDELEAARAAVHVPSFKPVRAGVARQAELELSPGHWQRLRAEARRQDAPLRRLLEHAALLYLADLA